jgi:hypothetical protein
MCKTYLYIISIQLVLIYLSGEIIAQEPATEEIQDSVTIPLKIRAGIEISGPVIYFTDKNILNAEGNLSADLNEKLAVFLGAGYSDFKYSQYNYEFQNKGVFFKAGIDINLLKPEVAKGKYWAGLGIRYGLSSFTSETPSFRHENYWGKTNSSLAPETSMGHYLEMSPGFRAELFNNFSIGWSISLRKLIYPGIKRDIRPIYFPGYGTAGESFSAGIGYFITWNIPFKKIRVAIKPEEPEEPLDEDMETPETGVNTESQSLGGSKPRIQPRVR